MELQPATRDRYRHFWFPITRDFELKSGNYQAKIVVRDTRSKRIGNVIHLHGPFLALLEAAKPVHAFGEERLVAAQLEVQPKERSGGQETPTLHEVERSSDHVVLLSHGYVVAEGQVHGMRREVTDHPMQILVRCSAAQSLAARLFAADHVVEVKLHSDGQGLLVRTRDADAFHRQLNRIVLEEQIELEAVAPADDDVNAVYQYLIGPEMEVS